MLIISPVTSNRSSGAVRALLLLLTAKPNAEGRLHSSVVQQKLQTSSKGIPLITTFFLHSFQHGVSFVAQVSEHPAVNPIGSIWGSTINWHSTPNEQFTGLVIWSHLVRPTPMKLWQASCLHVTCNSSKCAKLRKCNCKNAHFLDKFPLDKNSVTWFQFYDKT